ncbi:MAG TPA: PSD1 and planctomycete cytochrome C domain-containing protein [Pirellulaceae bacterium]|nr:PSD1 and planctomycete cytochrome C domain-containing protein [Pirellulaceae bacterium]
MRTSWRCAAITICLTVGNVGIAHAEDVPAITPAQEKFFEVQIRPLLVGRCVKCHGTEKQESGLRLDSRAAIIAGGEIGGASAVPGEPDKSLFIKVVKHEGDIQMPPKEKLSDAEIAALSDWVKDGLPWPNAQATTAPLSKEERLKHARATMWSLQPIVSPALPNVQQTGWPAQRLDFFILAKLEAVQLAPSPIADRRTLIRRATFDLHGLPPTPEEVEAFVSDSSPDAYARVIDRLLSSPRYGERWGRHWLDLARYADTSGYAFQRERKYPYSYTYRDYVIGAFNRNLPYDQFVVEQLAADKLPATPDNANLAALGFLTVGRKFNNRNDDIDDQIDVVSRGLMGLTVACARCHDHKYDAIPAEDYYSLYGVFASSNQPAELPMIGMPEMTAGYQRFTEELNKRRGEWNAYLDQRHGELVNKAREQAGDYLTRIASSKPEDLLSKAAGVSLGKADLKPKLVERWNKYLKDQAKPEHALLGVWKELTALAEIDPKPYAERATPIVDALLARPEGTAANQINPLLKAALTAQRPQSKIDVASLYGKLLSETFAAWKAAGGNKDAEGKLSEPQKQLLQLLTADNAAPTVPRDQIEGFLARDERDRAKALQRKIDEHQVNDPGAPPRAMVVRDADQPHNPKVFQRGDANRPGKPVPRQFVAVIAGPERKPFANGSGRLELAQSIVSADNPLTARVIANRMWMLNFGEPLVNTPGDFGIRSEKPAQSELLDYLASNLRNSGWSLKQWHRELMLSSTYQQASLDRDDCKTKDPENRLWWKTNRRRIEFEALRDSLLFVSGRLDATMGGRPVEIAKPPYSARRSVYGFIDRQDLPSLFRIFDLASPDTSNDRRQRTTVPQQALFLMNSPPVIEQSRALLARPEIAGVAATSDKIHAIYRLLFQRAPNTDEVTLGEQFITAASQDQAAIAKMSAWEQYSQLLLLTNEFTFVD